MNAERFKLMLSPPGTSIAAYAIELDYTTAGQLFRQADKALYIAKRTGKNKVGKHA